jgi:alkenylglycerophosphocholine/alkenylglycerophosphoethanolamine hydrolase
MRRPALLLVSYALVCTVHVLSQALELTAVAMATKPLLMPLLAAYLVSAAQRPFTRLVRVVAAALAFSWLGDVLLEAARHVDSDLLFLAGIGGFLVAQVLYIVAFTQLVRASTPPRPPVWALVYVLYGVGLVVLLGPDLGEFLVPVAVYAAAICTMGIVASGVNRFTALGAAVFIASDTMIAVGEFTDLWTLALNWQRVLVMTTYTVAQALLVHGVTIADWDHGRRHRPSASATVST